MHVWNVLHAYRWKYRTQKIAILAPSDNFVGLYLCNQGMYRQSEKKLVKQQYILHMSPQYGELRPTSGWDRFVSLGHSTKFQLVSSWQHYCTACSSGRRPNFTALNRGRHLCSAGRPSRWALAHIFSWAISLSVESTSELGEGNMFPMLLHNDRVSMIYAVFTTPRSVRQTV